jgi:hypothetical protein
MALGLVLLFWPLVGSLLRRIAPPRVSSAAA